ncbi:hypothetical protein BN77_1615 [Rhizobium mesoamericanum STM3625]|uniref:Uncharacterized protein n=1 Tax=Rhizobium mesoamericanum STM3625 TaxID=1211777 RepID=K0PSY7_9HYPH|nr:hypothetical protein BN77_1615 [Rhizobium mesoamericanum STM3625]
MNAFDERHFPKFTCKFTATYFRLHATGGYFYCVYNFLVILWVSGTQAGTFS